MAWIGFLCVAGALRGAAHGFVSTGPDFFHRGNRLFVCAPL
jgi:hypothetical protein